MTTHVEHVYTTGTGRRVHKRLAEGRMFVKGWARNLFINDSKSPTSAVTGPFIHIQVEPNRPDHWTFAIHIDLEMARKLAEDIQKTIADLEQRKQNL